MRTHNLLDLIAPKLTVSEAHRFAQALPGDLAHRLIERLPQPAALFGPRGELWGCSLPLLRLLTADSPRCGCCAAPLLESRLLKTLKRSLLESVFLPAASPQTFSLSIGEQDFQVDILTLGTEPASYLMLLFDGRPAWERRLPRLSKEYQFSPREEEILRQLARGKSNAEIAQVVGLSPQTVKTYMDRLRTKTGTKNRAALISLLLG